MNLGQVTDTGSDFQLKFATSACNHYRLQFHLRFKIDIETYRYKKADTEIRCSYTYEPLRADIITASPISAAHAAVRSISL